MTTHAEVINNLEAILMDPDIQKVFERIKVYNELLESQAVTEKEILDIINEIDSQWIGIIGSSATFTGQASFLSENDHSQVPQPVDDYYENQDISFTWRSCKTYWNRWRQRIR